MPSAISVTPLAPSALGLILDRALELAGRGLCQGAYARDREGRALVSWNDPAAVTFDLFGAIALAAREQLGSGGEALGAYAILIDRIYSRLGLPRTIDPPDHGGSWLARWIDERGRKGADIAGVLEGLKLGLYSQAGLLEQAR